MLYLEPREEYDQFIIGVAHLSVAERAFVYDEDAIIDYLCEKYALEDPTLSHEHAQLLALEHYEHRIHTMGGNGAPIYASRSELDIVREDEAYK